MSGVYIKGFRLPEKSDLYYVKVECEPGKNPVATIWRKDVLGPMSFGAFECIPIPDHGRLIDADALCDELVSNHPVAIYVKSAPTIIPAEEDTQKDGGQDDGA